jgi:hypothetical protein
MHPQRKGILVAKILMVLSASINFTLGVVHLVYMFWGPKLTPRDPALQIGMSQIAPVITSLEARFSVPIHTRPLLPDSRSQGAELEPRGRSFEPLRRSSTPRVVSPLEQSYSNNQYGNRRSLDLSGQKI